MTDRTLPNRIPTALLFGVGALVMASLLGVAWFRGEGARPLSSPPPMASAEVSVDMVIVPQAESGTDILDPATGEVVVTLAEGEDGFVRGILRGLYRIRDRAGVARDAPITVMAWRDGHAALYDPATNWRVELVGFGPDNRLIFVKLVSELADSGRQ